MIQKGFQEMKTQEAAAKFSAHKVIPTCLSAAAKKVSMSNK